jgi:hypothetical protein
MEIQVRKIKCTKSIVNQMECTVKTANLTGCEVLGYIRNIDKNTPKLILIKTASGKYCTVPPDFKAHTHATDPLLAVRVVRVGYITTVRFDSAESLAHWEELYMNVLKSATEQIYV